MLSLLAIPHSNTECEQIFSIVKKNLTNFRCGLSNETLENLMLLKIHRAIPCHEHTFNNDQFKKAKKVTSASLKCVSKNSEKKNALKKSAFN